MSSSPIFKNEVIVNDNRYEYHISDVWNMYIGDHKVRTDAYRDWICGILRSYKCRRVLDAAAGTGVDSAMLLEEQFCITSVDMSEQMLSKARDIKNSRKGEKYFDSWHIFSANWLELEENLREKGQLKSSGYDAVILLGNSFAHLPNEDGKCTKQKIALTNIVKVLNPGGVLIIDHRNYDAVIDGKRVQMKSPYYNGDRLVNLDTYLIRKNGEPHMVMLDYFLNISKDPEKKQDIRNFTMTYTPFRVAQMKRLLIEVFGVDNLETYGDFKEIRADTPEPGYFCHVIQKPNAETFKEPESLSKLDDKLF